MRLPRLLLCLFCLCSSFILSGQPDAEAPQELNILHPEDLFSFTGENGESFIRRTPVNLPQPIYRGQSTGLVPLAFTIQPNGSVTGVETVGMLLPGTTRDMVNAAVKAVQQWEFDTLPAKVAQQPMHVQTVIQYNQPESGIQYASDGSCLIRGLGTRRPAHIYKPGDSGEVHGIIHAVLRVKPDGSIHAVHKYTNEIEGEPVPPRLGILTYEAVSRWTFSPLPAPKEGEVQTDQDIQVTLRFMGANHGLSLNRSK